jgi:hypothetical protein
VTYIVDLYLAQRTRPAIEAKDLIREGYRLVAFEICNLAATIAWSCRNVLGPQLFVESTLQCRNFGRGEAVHDAFFVRIRDVAAVVLVTRPASGSVLIHWCATITVRPSTG